jgi:hypothetical protein
MLTFLKHPFLQRLPNIPQLRSLNIPYIADHIIGNIEPKELAMQIADIITLRPDIQLCYVGISTKCFEMLETSLKDGVSPASSRTSSIQSSPVSGSHSTVSLTANGVTAGAVVQDETSDEDDEDDEDEATEDEAEDEGINGDGTPTSQTDPEASGSENGEGAEDDEDDDSYVEVNQGNKTRLRPREILFYDDKVAIFKARHGRL